MCARCDELDGLQDTARDLAARYPDDQDLRAFTDQVIEMADREKDEIGEASWNAE